MRTNIIFASAVLCSLCLLPVTTMAGEFQDALKLASTEIDKAKALGYEWRDSRKILKEALKSEKAGEHDKAMKLANKARQQGIIAVTQAQQQANVTGPY